MKINWIKQEAPISKTQDKNPWLGLATYDTDDADRFRGRDKAIQDVFSLIDNNLVVTLYGKSGIGKSSLINAGIIPMLSHVGYKVVAVNIREMKASCLENENIYNRTIEYLKDLLHIELDIVDETSFWKILHNKVYFEGISAFPVIIFDQFEEVFLNISPEEADLFVKAISKLTDTGFSLEDDNYISNNRYRVLLSLREDDLFRLEDCIDRNGFSRMKANRYRLHSFGKSEAESIIALGEKYFEKYDSSKEKIIEMASLADGGVDAATLSLLCYRLFEKSRANLSNTIFDESISKEKDPLFKQYMEEISSLNYKEQVFIENNLITSSGRRDIVTIEKFRNNIKNAESLLENSELHFSLFREIDHGKNVELIHDSLAQAINKHREQRAYKKENFLYNSKRVLNQIYFVLCLTQLLIIIPFIYFVRHNATSTESYFFLTENWAWIILLVPILNLVTVSREKKTRNIYILAGLCGLMAINCAFPNSCLGYSVIVQILLYIVFFFYTLFCFKDKPRLQRILNISYLNLVTIACVLVGFGYNIFTVSSVVKLNSHLSEPWSYVIYENDSQYGYSDWNGNQVLPCVFDTIVVDHNNGNHLSKRVRALNLENEGIRNFAEHCNILPCFYKDGILSFYITPNVENQIKKLSDGTEESKLKASIMKKARVQIIKGFTDIHSLYDAELTKDIECLYNIQLESAYNLLESLNDSKSIITDKTVNDIRISLCQCICMLHLLESFAKQEDINDDDIAHSISALQLFTLYEIMDTNVKGYNCNFSLNTNLYRYFSDETSDSKRYDTYHINLQGFLDGNKRDVSSAFNSLISFDAGIHQPDLIELLNNSVNNLESIYHELLDIHDQTKELSADINKMKAMVWQNVISKLLDKTSVPSEQKKITQMQEDASNKYSQIIENTVSLLNKPVYEHNVDVFNYSKVISPLIECIAENDIPDQSAALTDIACRLIIMDLFRGLEMHDCIEELQAAYKKSTERTFTKTFELALKIDSMEVIYRQGINEYINQLNDISLKK